MKQASSVLMEKGRKTFSWEEICSLNREDNAHVAIRGKVYNVSKFLDRHPGGKDQLLIAAGRDVTLLFNTYHAFSGTAEKVLDKLYVGDLISNELPVFPDEPGLFYKTVRERVYNYFKETKQDPKFSWWMMVRYLLVPTVLLLSWSAQVFWLPHHCFMLSCCAAALMGYCCALLGMINMHDACHFAITHKPWVWKAVGSLHDLLNGSSWYIWIFQHVLGHHPYTNVDGADPDIQTADEPATDIRRIKWTQKYLTVYVYQHVYIPLVYCFLGVKTRVQDVIILFFSKKNGAIRVNRPSPYHLGMFVFGKVFFIAHRIILPLVLLPTWKFLVLFAIADIVASYWLALVFQVSHVVSEVDWPEPDKTGKVNRDWAELQIQTTQDYATDRWFWNVFTGALNHQTTHHLFPGISQYYYPQITPIVRRTCEEFGVRYNYKQTFSEALGAHIQHLKRLGQSEDRPRGTRQG